MWRDARPQLFPGLFTGIIAGAVLLVALNVAPAEVQRASETFHIPVSARLLYGGITEEILMRWGLMMGIA